MSELADYYSERIGTLQAQLAECERERCDHCGAKLNVLGCGTCGAPVCCPSCCRVATLEQQLAACKSKLDRTQRSSDLFEKQVIEREQQLANTQTQLALLSGAPDQVGSYAWYRKECHRMHKTINEFCVLEESLKQKLHEHGIQYE